MRRALLVALGTCGLAATAVPAATAAPIDVHVRVEGASGTVFDRVVRTDGHDIQASSDTQTRRCDGTNLAAHPTPGPTPTAATVDALALIGEDFDAGWFDQYDDYFIERLGSESQDIGEGWYFGILVNGDYTPVGGCQFRINSGDEVLWVNDAFSSRKFLTLDAPAQAVIGQPLSVAVQGRTNLTDASGPAYAGATVAPVDAFGRPAPASIAAASNATGADGQTTVTFRRAGWHRLKATHHASGTVDAAVASASVDVCVRASANAPTCQGTPPSQRPVGTDDPQAPSRSNGTKTVSVRVEGQTETLLPPTKVTIDADELASFTTAGGATTTCAGDSASAALDVATRGDWDQAQYLSTILGESHTFADNDYWNLSRNNVYSANFGSCDLILEDGDTVLFQATKSGWPSDDLSTYLTTTGVPRVVTAGKPFTVTTLKHAQTDGTPSPAAGFSLSLTDSTGSANSVLLDASGATSITLPAPELYTVQALKSPAGDDWGRSAPQLVCVETPADRCRKLTAPAAQAFADQPLASIGGSVKITYTVGRLALAPSRVWVEGADAADFLVGAETCTAGEIAATQSCTVQVRFAPEALGTRTATLKVRSDAYAGDTAVALTGQGLEQAAGPKGDKGDAGDAGAKGDKGDTGNAGTNGTNGSNGTNGAAGAKGDTGAAGATGPRGDKGDTGAAGPKGDTGATGPAGANGKDGVVTLTAPASVVQAQRGRTARLRVTVKNATTATFPRTSAVAITPSALRVSRKGSAVVHSIGKGDERTVTVPLTIARTAKRGTYRVKVRLKVGERAVSTTVRVRVN